MVTVSIIARGTCVFIFVRDIHGDDEQVQVSDAKLKPGSEPSWSHRWFLELGFLLEP